MKKILFLILSVASLNAQAQKTSTPVKKTTTAAKKPATTGKKPPVATAVSRPVLKNMIDSASYAMGISMASFYAQQGIKNINPNLVAQAIRDVSAGKTTPIKEAEANDVVMKLMNKVMESKSKGTIDAGEAFLAANKKRSGVKTTASGLQYEVITEGQGPKPLATDDVTVNYVGTLIDGTEFDNSYKRGEPISFNLGRVITGWTEGVQLMPAGSKYKFYIPYQLGYGVHGTGPIPGGAALIFEIELISIKGK
jgi:FKBP-type peptidyl-prolyl cis-trans isomerase FklB